jgi:hypothetical protein
VQRSPDGRSDTWLRRSSSSAAANVDGNSVNWTNESSTSSASNWRWSNVPRRSREIAPRKATSLPNNRPMVLAALNGPPPSDRAVGIDDQIDQRFPTDVDHLRLPSDMVDDDTVTTLSASSHVQ